MGSLLSLLQREAQKLGLMYELFVLILMYEPFRLISMYELMWLNSAAIMIYYMCCTNGAILLYEYIFFMGKWPSPPVPSTNRRWWALITNGGCTHHQRFMNRRWWAFLSPPVLKPAVMTPPITIDLNPTPPKPAVMGAAVVVHDWCRVVSTCCKVVRSKRTRSACYLTTSYLHFLAASLT